MEPVLFIPAGGVIILVGFVTFRWLARLQSVADDHAERIAWLEAKVNGKKHREDV